jgi:hypothetical protein
MPSSTPTTKVQALLLASAVAGVGVGAVALGSGNWRMGALLAVGAALGATLYMGGFGFAGALRRVFIHRDAGTTAGVRLRPLFGLAN